MGRLIMVRHGESEGNRKRRFTTTPSVPLTAVGRDQAQAAGRRIARMFKPGLVVASPYARARETAEIIAAQFGFEVEIEPNLFERRFGSLAGESYDIEMAELAFDPIARWHWRPPGGGESFEDVRLRIAPVLEKLARENPDTEVVVVSHGVVMLTAWAHLTGGVTGVEIPRNCGIVLVDHEDGGFSPPLVVPSE